MFDKYHYWVARVLEMPYRHLLLDITVWFVNVIVG